MSSTTPHGEIRALTSLRGIAAMAVVLQHFSTTAQQHCAVAIPSLVPHGYMAVDFFFVLSGFIMSYNYLDAFRRDGMRAYGPFLLKRVGRLYPLGIAMVVVLLALGGIASLFGQRSLFVPDHVMRAGLGSSILVNVLGLQAFSNEHNLNAPSWSISVEMGAYLAFPFLAFAAFRARWAAATCLIVAVAALTIHALGEPLLGLGGRSVAFDFTRCFAEFGLGMLVYRVYRSGHRLLAVIGRDAWTWGLSALSVLSLVLRVDLVIALLFPLVVLTWALNTGRARTLLSSSVPYQLGTISFSIYLVHDLFRQPELLLVKALFPQPLPAASALAFAALGSFSVVPFAALAYRWVERPGRHAVMNLANRMTRRPDRVPTAQAR